MCYTSKFILQAQAVLKYNGPRMTLRRKQINRQNAIRSKFESMHFSNVSIKTGLSDLKMVHFTHSSVMCIFMHVISNMLNSNEISCMSVFLFVCWVVFCKIVSHLLLCFHQDADNEADYKVLQQSWWTLPQDLQSNIY